MRFVQTSGTGALKVLLWLLVTAGVAFLVARSSGQSTTVTDPALHVPQIQADQRQTTALEDVTIQPTLSGDGTVDEGEKDGTFVLQTTITTADQAYRLLHDPVGVKALIVGGPAGFDCAWNGLVNTPSGLMMQCRIPNDIEVVAGLQGTMVLQLDDATEVTGLPVSAVVGTNQTGQVIVVQHDGSTEVRQVDLGRNDTFNVEITGGLNEGEEVYLNPVQSDFSGAGR